jgi:hypothetical protein
MPVDLTVFTADRRIQGAIPLADDRVSDMLNSVARVVIRGARIDDLLEPEPPETADVTIPVAAIVAVLVTGRSGIQSRRRKTELHPVRLGIVRYVVSGWLHVPAGSSTKLASQNPAIVLAGRDALVPLTEATIAYDRVGQAVTEDAETILINRGQATWIDVDDAAAGDGVELFVEQPKVYHAAIAKDLTEPR